MRRSALLGGVLALLPALAYGQATTTKEVPFQWVGFTVSTLASDSGWRAGTAQCQTDHDVDARICYSDEVLSTVVLPTVPAVEGWVYHSGGWSLFGHNCDNWQTDSGLSNGTIVDHLGNFSSVSCSTPRRFACCRPIPLPEPTSSLGLGSGVVALLGLKALRDWRSPSC